jgi:hypothetical protein
MSKTGKSIISFTVILLPCFVYLIYSFLNSGTLFRADDFHLLKTVVWMQDANGPVEKFKLLIQQHNEHSPFAYVPGLRHRGRYKLAHIDSDR